MRLALSAVATATLTLALADRAELDLGPGPVQAMDDDIGSLPTDEIIVALRPGEPANLFAATTGLVLVSTSPAAPDEHVFRASSVGAAQALVKTLLDDSRVRMVYPNDLVFHQLMAFSPNDPFFNRNFPSPGAWGQWHLENQHGTGNDVRARGAWNRGVTGLGVTIGIIDDSLESAHPDLAPNYSAEDSFDFGSNPRDADPNPVLTTDEHGISVAGVAAARGGNGIGGTGAAPLAALAGLRCTFGGGGTANMFRDATLFRSSGAITTIDVKNHSYGYTVPFVSATAERDALETSSAVGTLHAFAAGNSRGTRNQDAAKSMVLNSPSTITVAALGSNGVFADYSNFGGNVVVTAPSSSSGFFGITTTDRTGSLGYNGFASWLDYTPNFGGTSSATPLVAGILALGKQVNPNLSARLTKHLLARSADVVNPTDATSASDGGWRTNAAGFRFNQNYGWGRIDADEFTQLCALYSGVTPLQTRSIPTTTVGAAIPDGQAAGLSRTFTVSETTPLEDVLVTLRVTHTRRGNLTAFLTSPQGTRSRLFISSASDSPQNLNWTFLNHAFWGENPQGAWTLTVADVTATHTGTWNSYGVTLRMGQPVKASQPVHGRLLVHFLGSMAGFPATLTVRDASNLVVDTQTLPLSADGWFTYTSSLRGTHSLSVKAGMWLRERVTGVTLGGGPVYLDFPMRNGDIVEDNEVNIDDFLALAAAYETVVGDAAFSHRADLDGSGAVDVDDFLALSATFDQVGAP